MKKIICFISLLALAATIGCGPSRPETASIEGTVTYQGNPVEGARVSFYPSSGRPANGMTNAEGKFTLMTFEVGDGAILGEQKVTIAKQKMTAPPSAQNPRGTMQYFIPERYANATTSGLTATVKRGDNDFTFDLTD